MDEGTFDTRAASSQRARSLPTDLWIFGAVASEGTLCDAARRLDVPKATLSRAIKRLEAAVRAPLFDRTGRGLSLTPLGEALCPAARRIAAAVSEADELLRSLTDAPGGTLRIAAAPLAAREIVVPALTALAAAHPEVRTDLTVSGRARDPVTEEFDVLLRLGEPTETHLTRRRIRSIPMHAFGSAETLLGVDVNDPEEVAALDRIGIGGTPLAGVWSFTCGERHVEMRHEPVAVLNDIAIALEMARASHALVLAPQDYAERLLRDHDLRPVLPGWSGPTLDVFAVMPSRRAEIPAVRAFLDLAYGQRAASPPAPPSMSAQFVRADAGGAIDVAV